MDGWKTQLTNSDAVLSLLLSRLESDFSGTLAKKWKPFNGVAIAPWLHCLKPAQLPQQWVVPVSECRKQCSGGVGCSLLP